MGAALVQEQSGKPIAILHVTILFFFPERLLAVSFIDRPVFMIPA